MLKGANKERQGRLPHAERDEGKERGGREGEREREGSEDDREMQLQVRGRSGP